MLLDLRAKGLNVDAILRKRIYHPVCRPLALLAFHAGFDWPTVYFYVHYENLTKLSDTSIAIKKIIPFSFNKRDDKKHIDAPTYGQVCRFLGFNRQTVSNTVLTKALNERISYKRNL